ncbi:Dabb family protein [Spirosoma daeguense]
MFVHTVFFWMKHPENKADHDALRAGLESLKEISDISVAYVGTPAETRRPVIDHSYDFALTLVFADKAAHDTYQEHPIHLKFVADCAHIWEGVKIYDAVS